MSAEEDGLTDAHLEALGLLPRKREPEPAPNGKGSGRWDVSSLDDKQWERALLEREKLVRASGSKQYRGVDVKRTLRKMNGWGWSTRQCAEGLGLSIRSIQVYHQQEQKPQDMAEGKVAPKPSHRQMLEYTPEAFEQWFLEFSPYDYLPEHAKSWITAFMGNRNLMLNVPPGHAKSEFFMIWIPVWLICRNRNVQILMVSNSAEDAATWALEVAGQLQSNDDLIAAYGRFAPDNLRQDHRWTPARGTFTVRGRTKSRKGAQYTVESRGMTGRVLGRRADYILVDDPTKQEDAASETANRTQMEHLRQQVFSRAEPNSTIMVIGQRVHRLDLYGELERQERVLGAKKGERYWHVEKYPAVLRWPVDSSYRAGDDDPQETEPEVLWPQRWPYEELMEVYEAVGGEEAFFTMYQQEPSPESMAVFKERHLIACRNKDREAGEGLGTEGFFPRIRVVSVDPSPTQYNGIIVGDLLYNKFQFLFAVTEVHKIKASLPDLKALIDNIIAVHRPDYFIFEESGFLLWLRDDPWFAELRQRVRFLFHKTGMNKNSREFGVQSLAVDFENQRIDLPFGDEKGRQMTALLHNEAVLYPSSATYDTLMALWFIKYNWLDLKPPREKNEGRKPGQSWGFIKQMRKKKNPFRGYQKEYDILKEKADA